MAVAFEYKNGFKANYNKKVAEILEKQGKGKIVGEAQSEPPKAPAGGPKTGEPTKQELYDKLKAAGVELQHVANHKKDELQAMVDELEKENNSGAGE